MLRPSCWWGAMHLSEEPNTGGGAQEEFYLPLSCTVFRASNLTYLSMLSFQDSKMCEYLQKKQHVEKLLQRTI